MKSMPTPILLTLLLATSAIAADYELEDVASGMDHPWSVAFLPNGDFLVTERSGQLLRISGDEKTEIRGVPETYVAGQGGFFDIVLAPDFATSGVVFLSYADGRKRSNRTAVYRATLEGDALTGGTVIFEAEPDKNTAHHYGGRMAFLPDGTLLIATGEGYSYKDEAQSVDGHFGKVIRINSDGTAPRDNPFPNRGALAAKVWSYGHRNPQGLAIDPETGIVWLHEHGPRGGDEVNIVEPGLNYGWPAITYGIDYSGAMISPYKALDGMEQPLKYWVPSIAPSGLAVYRGDAFPQWQGDLFVGGLKSRDVRRLTVDGNTITDEETLFAIGERVRDVRVGPDGLIYLLTDSSKGRLIRVRPK